MAKIVIQATITSAQNDEETRRIIVSIDSFEKQLHADFPDAHSNRTMCSLCLAHNISIIHMPSSCCPLLPHASDCDVNKDPAFACDCQGPESDRMLLKRYNFFYEGLADNVAGNVRADKAMELFHATLRP